MFLFFWLTCSQYKSIQSIQSIQSIHFHGVFVGIVVFVVIGGLGFVILRIVCHHAKAHAQVQNLSLQVHGCAVVLTNVIVGTACNDCRDALVQIACVGPAIQRVTGGLLLIVTQSDLKVHVHRTRVFHCDLCAILSRALQLILQALVSFNGLANELFHFITSISIFIRDVVVLNHVIAAHGALVAIVSAVGQVAHDAREMELVPAVQAHEVAGGVGCIKADRAAVVFFFGLRLWLLRFFGLRLCLCFIIVFNQHNLVVFNHHNFFLIASWYRRQRFFFFLNHWFLNHLQRSDLGGCEYPVFTIGACDVDGALPVQHKQ